MEHLIGCDGALSCGCRDAHAAAAAARREAEAEAYAEAAARRARSYMRPAFGEPVTPWVRWFAWRPVNTLDRGWRWLVPCWRRRCASHDYLDGPLVSWFQTVRLDPSKIVLAP